MAHISRKELKKDEFRESLAHGADAVLSHQQLTLYLLIAALVIALGGYGWWTYSERQTLKASVPFDAAMKIFEAPIATPGAPPTPGVPTYTDADKKYADAAQKFGDVAAKYPHTRPGQLAKYYYALSLEKLGKNDQARSLLQPLAGGNGEFAAMAKFELAELDDFTGRGDEAVKFYQQLMDKPTLLVPKPVAMLALAEHYREKDPAQAAKLYGQIKSEYPDTKIADQASQELALLPGKS
ncbi:MAG: tetratricopeptide repeat protein [Candidatus Acidiferrales bacterium]